MPGTAAANRAGGLARLADFVDHAGRKYAEFRNYDFGPERRDNVSLLSPFVRHRLILEQELIEAALERHTLKKAEKFIQEVFWRTYFKGWLEHRPSVWRAYRSAVDAQIARLDMESQLLDRYVAATSAATGIDCFDSWVGELTDSGYLHNHARMWFASIWVYTLGLPWQLGADFFLRHLLDGDPASNTLSWRWVCGLHTRGKTYLARASNIRKYTHDRFDPEAGLATSAPPLTEAHAHPVRDLPPAAPNSLPHGHIGLLLTEEDCFAENLLSDLRPQALCAVIATAHRSPLPVGKAALRFARSAVHDALNRAEAHYGLEGDTIDSEASGSRLAEWAASHDLDAVLTPYVPTGPVRDVLEQAEKQLQRYGVDVIKIRRNYDSVAWPNARRGYFKLRAQIPAILETL